MTIPKNSFEAFQKKVRMREKNGAIEISFTYQGKTRYIGAGPYIPINIAKAQAKMQQIALDLFSGNFDETLAKYKSPIALQRSDKEQAPEIPTILELWRQFLEQLTYHTKVTTQIYNAGFTSLFEKIGNIPIENAEEVKIALLKITTPGQTKRALSRLSAACRWGMKKKLVPQDYYQDMAKELPKFRYQLDPKPNAFNAEEAAQVIAAFQNDRRPGISYSRYAPLVEFWFLTGCRPSEGIGLQWKNVSEDFSWIYFRGSITQVGGKPPIRVEYSKNNKSRDFPCSPRLKELLKSIKPEHCNPEMLVFPSSRGDEDPINYNGFCRRAWTTLVDPIKPETTPYSCRDTFITLQLLAGQPTYLIAKWCDTSIEMIEKHYADFLRMNQITPTDFLKPLSTLPSASVSG